MASYRKKEAREWAREHLRGVCNVVVPSYTGDLKGLNELGIRHDIRLEIEYGFFGTLLVSEVAITLDEYRQFFEWSHDEAKGKLMLVHHASFNDLEENIEAVKIAEQSGGELILLSYPANMYAETPQDIYDYTKAFCDATDLAVMLFPVPLWGFNRVHRVRHRGVADPPPHRRLPERRRHQGGRRHAELHALDRVPPVVRQGSRDQQSAREGHDPARAGRTSAVQRYQQHRVFRTDDPAHLQAAAEG